ncbi:SLAIN motif-containing protein 2-like isoform X2 [Argiope bruennichi]|nr:SLAIN motif-containing protein 2-like isoform X2 [Argiope bruennichi]
MSLIMEDFKTSVNTLEEVKKLQELVRKLELQNLHLRNKQNIPRKRSVSPVKDVKSRNATRSARKTSEAKGDVDNESNVENSVFANKDEYFDNLEIIRVSDIEMSDDESWLYTSPKSAKQQQTVESPYKWLRKDVDDPENKQLQLAKKALLTKLNELEILSPPNKVTTHHAENPVVSNLRRSQMMYKTPLSVQNHDPTHVDTRTFTRSKKKQAIEFLEKLDSLSIEKSEKAYTVQLYRSDVSSDSVSSCHILEDANDVQEVARMQEESLRMSSPLGTPKRGSVNSSSSRKVSTSSRGSTSDQDMSETSVFSSQNPYESTSYECVENCSYSIDSYNHSDQSSPSESPYGSNASLHNAGKGKSKLGTYRRSLPNLNREQLALRQSKNKLCSDSTNQIHSQVKGTLGRKSDSQMHSVQKTRREVKSPSRVKQSNQMFVHQPIFQSPENSEPLTDVPKSADSADLRMRSRSGLPRPSRASSASRSVAR